jgi:hypothetical protein
MDKSGVLCRQQYLVSGEHFSYDKKTKKISIFSESKKSKNTWTDLIDKLLQDKKNFGIAKFILSGLFVGPSSYLRMCKLEFAFIIQDKYSKSDSDNDEKEPDYNCFEPPTKRMKNVDDDAPIIYDDEESP